MIVINQKSTSRKTGKVTCFKRIIILQDYPYQPFLFFCNMAGWSVVAKAGGWQRQGTGDRYLGGWPGGGIVDFFRRGALA